MGCCSSRNSERSPKQTYLKNIYRNHQFQIDQIFSTYDTNNDGCLDRQQTRNFLNDLIQKSQYHITDEYLTRFFEIADLNKDGLIQKEQLTVLLNNLMVYEGITHKGIMVA